MIRNLDRLKLETFLRSDVDSGYPDLGRVEDAERAVLILEDYFVSVSNAVMPKRGGPTPAARPSGGPMRLLAF